MSYQMTEPVVTIVTACRNHGAFLREAVASVERHAPPWCEHVIVDDGSTQRATRAVMRELRERGGQVITQPHGGLSRARNAGIAAARGRYILPLDADNHLCAGYIEKAVAVLDAQPEIGVVYSDCYEFGQREGCRKVEALNLQRPTIDACAVFRKQLWADCGGYDATLQSWNDWELWVHAATLGWRFHHLPEPLFNYRVRANSLGGSISRREVRKTLWTLLSKHGAFYRQHCPELWDDDLDHAADAWLEQLKPHPARQHGWPKLILWRIKQKFAYFSR